MDCEGGADVPLSASHFSFGNTGSLAPCPPYFAVVTWVNGAVTGLGQDSRAPAQRCEAQGLRIWVEEAAGWEGVGS